VLYEIFMLLYSLLNTHSFTYDGRKCNRLLTKEVHYMVYLKTCMYIYKFKLSKVIDFRLWTDINCRRTLGPLRTEDLYWRMYILVTHTCLILLSKNATSSGIDWLTFWNVYLHILIYIYIYILMHTHI
jgi:hypothetical protein